MRNYTLLVGGVAAFLLPAAPRFAAPAKRPSVPRPAVSGRAPAPAPPGRITPASLRPVLLALGYRPESRPPHQRLRVEAAAYDYSIDLAFTPTGEWLVCMAHLAPLPDLTRVPAARLLTLLGYNDRMVGMYFSYERANARLMLNAAMPARSLDGASLRQALERLKATVAETEDLWDPAAWGAP